MKLTFKSSMGSYHDRTPEKITKRPGRNIKPFFVRVSKRYGPGPWYGPRTPGDNGYHPKRLRVPVTRRETTLIVSKVDWYVSMERLQMELRLYRKIG